jgi:hypothetical protein
MPRLMSRRAQRLRRLGGAAFIYIGNHGNSPGLGQYFGNPAANAAGAACYQRHAPSQTESFRHFAPLFPF